jgi:hypothetical protein
MNERIKYLAEQCRAEYRDGHGGYIEQFDEEKFAELIVEECCLKLLNMDEKTQGNHNYYRHAAIEVKKHFGVEE